MKIALFRKIMDGGYTFDMLVKHEDCTPGGVYEREYTQMSDWADVEFVLLPPEAVVEGQLKQIDVAEGELRNRFQKKLNELSDARSRLLSLSHESEPDLGSPIPETAFIPPHGASL